MQLDPLLLLISHVSLSATVKFAVLVTGAVVRVCPENDQFPFAVTDVPLVDPIVTFVVDPLTPAVPILTVLVLPEIVAPVPKPYVDVAVDEPTVTVAAENVVVPENVCVLLSSATVPDRLGSVIVRLAERVVGVIVAT